MSELILGIFVGVSFMVSIWSSRSFFDRVFRKRVLFFANSVFFVVLCVFVIIYAHWMTQNEGRHIELFDYELNEKSIILFLIGALMVLPIIECYNAFLWRSEKDVDNSEKITATRSIFFNTVIAVFLLLVSLNLVKPNLLQNVKSLETPWATIQLQSGIATSSKPAYVRDRLSSGARSVAAGNRSSTRAGALGIIAGIPAFMETDIKLIVDWNKKAIDRNDFRKSDALPDSYNAIKDYIVPIANCLEFIDDQVRYRPAIEDYVTNVANDLRAIIRPSLAQEAYGKISEQDLALLNKSWADLLKHLREALIQISRDGPTLTVAKRATDGSEEPEANCDRNQLNRLENQSNIKENDLKTAVEVLRDSFNVRRPYLSIILSSLLALADQPVAAALEIEQWINLAKRKVANEGEDEIRYKVYLARASLIQALFIEGIGDNQLKAIKSREYANITRNSLPDNVLDILELEIITGKCINNININNAERRYFLAYIIQMNNFAYYASFLNQDYDRYSQESVRIADYISEFPIQCYAKGIDLRKHLANLMHTRARVLMAELTVASERQFNEAKIEEIALAATQALSCGINAIKMRADQKYDAWTAAGLSDQLDGVRLYTLLLDMRSMKKIVDAQLDKSSNFSRKDRACTRKS